MLNANLAVLLGVENDGKVFVSNNHAAFPMVEGDVGFAIRAAAAVDETLGTRVNQGILEG